MGHAAKRGVCQGAKIGGPNTRGLSAQASRRTERARRCACVGRARFAALFEASESAAREARSTRVLVLGARSRQLGQVPRVTRVQKLLTAQEGIHKAPCAWRTPPPIRGRSPYYPYAKVISGARSGPPCTPPQPGQAPLLPVCKSYQQRTKRPPEPNGAGFRVILYWLRQRVWVVVPLAEPHSGCPARLDPSRPSGLQRRLGLTSSPEARMPMYMAKGMLACLGFRV